MCYILDDYSVRYNDKPIGQYYVFDNKVSYRAGYGCPWDMKDELEAIGLDREYEDVTSIEIFDKTINPANRVAGRKRIIYRNGALTMERVPKESGERYSVYRRSAEKGEPDYSPFAHDAPHREGNVQPEGMREWASWYAFNKMDDGTYQAELDEAWWWGGGHNDGGTIRTDIPEEWFELPYDEFLSNVVTLSAAAHYGFTPEILKGKTGLKKFFGY